MLKPVVEQVHGGAELAFGKAAGEKALARDQNRHATEGASEHLRLVA